MDKKWSIFCLVATSIFMSTLDSSIVNVALPYIMQELNTQIEVIQWVVLVYLLTVSSFLLTFGRLSDIKGRRIIYCYGFLIFTFGSLLCSLSMTPWFLILSRGVQGLGASMLMACSPALIVDVFEPHERGKILGITGAVVAAGLTIGPFAGGILLEYFSWRYIFYINLPIGLTALTAGIYILKNTSADQGSNEPLDKTGALLLIMTLTSFIVLLTHIDKWNFFSIKIAATSMIFFLSSLGFIRTESKIKYPLFDPGLLKIRLFIFPVIASAILFAALFSIVFIMPFFLVHPCGFSASKTGMIMITTFVFLLLLSPVSGSLYNRMGSRVLCTTGMIFVLGSLFSLMFIEPSMPVFSIVWRLALTGIGTALFISPNNTLIMNSVPLSRKGIASGAVATSRNLGMVTGAAIAGLIFSVSFSSLSNGAGLENYDAFMNPFFMTSFKRTMAAGLFLTMVGIIVTILRGQEKQIKGDD